MQMQTDSKNSTLKEHESERQSDLPIQSDSRLNEGVDSHLNTTNTYIEGPGSVKYGIALP